MVPNTVPTQRQPPAEWQGNVLTYTCLPANLLYEMVRFLHHNSSVRDCLVGLMSGNPDTCIVEYSDGYENETAHTTKALLSDLLMNPPVGMDDPDEVFLRALAGPDLSRSFSAIVEATIDGDRSRLGLTYWATGRGQCRLFRIR